MRTLNREPWPWLDSSAHELFQSQLALIEGLGAVGFGYNLGCTDGDNADLDMIAIERAAKQQEGFKAKSNEQKKQAVSSQEDPRHRKTRLQLQKRQVQTAA
jgi:hypothetical protein